MCFRDVRFQRNANFIFSNCSDPVLASVTKAKIEKKVSKVSILSVALTYNSESQYKEMMNSLFTLIDGNHGIVHKIIRIPFGVRLICIFGANNAINQSFHAVDTALAMQDLVSSISKAVKRDSAMRHAVTLGSKTRIGATTAFGLTVDYANLTQNGSNWGYDGIAECHEFAAIWSSAMNGLFSLSNSLDASYIFRYELNEASMAHAIALESYCKFYNSILICDATPLNNLRENKIVTRELDTVVSASIHVESSEVYES